MHTKNTLLLLGVLATSIACRTGAGGSALTDDDFAGATHTVTQTVTTAGKTYTQTIRLFGIDGSVTLNVLKKMADRLKAGSKLLSVNFRVPADVRVHVPFSSSTAAVDATDEGSVLVAPYVLTIRDKVTGNLVPLTPERSAAVWLHEYGHMIWNENFAPYVPPTLFPELTALSKERDEKGAVAQAKRDSLDKITDETEWNKVVEEANKLDAELQVLGEKADALCEAKPLPCKEYNQWTTGWGRVGKHYDEYFADVVSTALMGSGKAIREAVCMPNDNSSKCTVVDFTAAVNAPVAWADPIFKSAGGHNTFILPRRVFGKAMAAVSTPAKRIVLVRKTFDAIMKELPTMGTLITENGDDFAPLTVEAVNKRLVVELDRQGVR